MCVYVSSVGVISEECDDVCNPIYLYCPVSVLKISNLRIHPLSLSPPPPSSHHHFSCVLSQKKEGGKEEERKMREAPEFPGSACLCYLHGRASLAACFAVLLAHTFLSLEQAGLKPPCHPSNSNSTCRPSPSVTEGRKGDLPLYML